MSDYPTIPAAMPVLASGLHGRPEDGACAMEYISLLMGEKFSDFPSCTEPAVALAVQIVNDILSDGDRAAVLFPYLERIMHARPLPLRTPPLTDRVQASLAKQGQYMHQRVAARRRKEGFEFPTFPLVGYHDPDALRRHLEAVLDHYDRLALACQRAQAMRGAAAEAVCHA